MRKIALLLATAALTVGALARPAAADSEEYNKDTWPLAVVDRPILIPAGMLELRGDTVRLGLDKGSAGNPIALAPDVFYGVARMINVGIVHRDTGICIAGDRCTKAYNDIGLDALYGFANKGSFQVSALGGLRVPSFDNLVAGLDLGLLFQLSAGKVQVNVDPTLYVGIAGRTADNVGDAAQKEQLEVPVVLTYQLQPQTALFVRTGMTGPLSGFGNDFEVPIGIGATLAANNRLDFGLEFLMANPAGNAHSFDQRTLIGRIALRL